VFSVSLLFWKGERMSYGPKPFDLWTKEHCDQALEEGWVLSNYDSYRPGGTGYSHVAIFKLDDPAAVDGLGYDEPKFATDNEAVDYVVAKALQGSKMHMLAIWLEGHIIERPLVCDCPELLQQESAV